MIHLLVGSGVVVHNFGLTDDPGEVSSTESEIYIHLSYVVVVNYHSHNY